MDKKEIEKAKMFIRDYFTLSDIKKPGDSEGYREFLDKYGPRNQRSVLLNNILDILYISAKCVVGSRYENVDNFFSVDFMADEVKGKTDDGIVRDLTGGNYVSEIRDILRDMYVDLTVLNPDKNCKCPKYLEDVRLSVYISTAIILQDKVVKKKIAAWGDVMSNVIPITTTLA